MDASLPGYFNDSFFVRIIATIIGVFLLGFSAYQAARIAWADSLYQQNSPETARAAVRLDPANASYHSLLALHLESSGKDSASELRAASQVSPFDARYLNQLGFRAEVEQDYPAAELALLRAAQLDLGFRPRWALMNFYFRRERDAEFWLWAKRSLARGYGDLKPVFRLCWAQTDINSTIEHSLLPDPTVRLRYLEYLNAEQPPAAADRIAQQVAGETNESAGVNAALSYCSRAMQPDPAGALAVWNTLCRRKLVPHAALDPAVGAVVTNGTFGVEPNGKGFDWRIRQFDGVTVSVGPETGLILRLDGTQPEIFDLLEQPVPLERGRNYRLAFTYQVAPGTSTGLHWRIDGADFRPMAASGVLSGDRLQEENVTFNSGQNKLAVLRLGFRRVSGTVRWSGTATIREVSIQPLP